MRKCSRQVSLNLVAFQKHQHRFWTRTCSCNCLQYLCLFDISLSPTQINVVKEYFMSIFHIGSMFCFFPDSFISSTYTDKNSPFSRFANEHSQCGTFSQPCSDRTFPNCLSYDGPGIGWPYRFRSRGTTGSSILDHDFVHLCCGRRIWISGHFDFGFFISGGATSISTWVRRYSVCCLSCASW